MKSLEVDPTLNIFWCQFPLPRNLNATIWYLNLKNGTKCDLVLSMPLNGSESGSKILLVNLDNWSWHFLQNQSTGQLRTLGLYFLGETQVLLEGVLNEKEVYESQKKVWVCRPLWAKGVGDWRFKPPSNKDMKSSASSSKPGKPSKPSNSVTQPTG